MNGVKEQQLRRFRGGQKSANEISVRRFHAAVLRRLAAVLKSRGKSMCGGSAAVVARNPHTPYAPRGALEPRRARRVAGRDFSRLPTILYRGHSILPLSAREQR